MHTLHGAAADLGKGRQEGQLGLSAGVEYGAELRPHIAPEGGIRLLIDVRNLQPGCQGDNPEDDLIGLGSGKVPGLRIHYQHIQIPGALAPVCGGIGDDGSFGTPDCQLHTGVQGPGKIIRDNQQLNHGYLSFSRCLDLSLFYQPFPSASMGPILFLFIFGTFYFLHCNFPFYLVLILNDLAFFTWGPFQIGTSISPTASPRPHQDAKIPAAGCVAAGIRPFSFFPRPNGATMWCG